jgi:hypothetical protein
MGTRPGVGHARKPPVSRKDGEVREIEQIRVLSKLVLDETRASESVLA